MAETEVLDKVRELREQIQEKNQARLRLEAERDAAKAHHDEAILALQRFGVETLEEAEKALADLDAEISVEIQKIQEALDTPVNP